VQEKEKEKKQLCLSLLCLLCFLANWKDNCFVGGEMVEQEGYSENIELSFFLCVV
jgi:hypothetical protein